MSYIFLILNIFVFCTANARWVPLPRNGDCVTEQAYGSWSECITEFYNNGTQYRVRMRTKSVIIPPKNNGAPCPPPDEDMEYCKNEDKEPDENYAEEDQKPSEPDPFKTDSDYSFRSQSYLAPRSGRTTSSNESRRYTTAKPYYNRSRQASYTRSQNRRRNYRNNPYRIPPWYLGFFDYWRSY